MNNTTINPSADIRLDCSTCLYKSLLFDSLKKKDLQKINSKKTHREYEKGERICIEGERIENLIYIHKGLVKLSKRNNDGQVQILSIARPLDYIGLLSVFSNDFYRYSLTAIEPTSVCFIDLDSFREAIKSNGDFALEIVEKMSIASDEILSIKVDLAKKTLKSKMAYILLYFSEKIYDSNSFTLPVSRGELAELLDVRVENVIRVLSEYRKNKLIETKGQEVKIIDIEAVRKAILA